MVGVSGQPESRVLAHPIQIAADDETPVTEVLPGNVTALILAR
jgi:hypothetical protein